MAKAVTGSSHCLCSNIGLLGYASTAVCNFQIIQSVVTDTLLCYLIHLLLEYCPNFW
jgi:hypothetical protein